MEVFKSGFVGLIGRTNVGKSTLINKILKQKVVITSDKPQTTRSRINCILNIDNAQIIFVDCPGFFKPRSLLGERLNNIIYRVLDDVDVITVMMDVAGGIGPGDYFVLENIKDRKKPKILLLNKIDLVSNSRVEDERKKVESYDFFSSIISISAITGENVEKFLDLLINLLPEGPKYFPEDMVTDQPLVKIISEIIREKLFNNISDEIPHCLDVGIENLEETKTKSGEDLIKIECNIFTEKPSQKAIIIGKEGNMLKKVGTQSRLELESLLGCRVFLKLWVKVKENWTKKESYLAEFGY